MTNIHVNVHLTPEDEIVIQRADHTWLRIGECVIHATPADLDRIRYVIESHLTTVARAAA